MHNVLMVRGYNARLSRKNTSDALLSLEQIPPPLPPSPSVIGRSDVYQAAAPLLTNQSGRLASLRFLLADRVIYVPTRPVWQVVKRVVDTRHNDACHKATRPHSRLASIRVINSALHFVGLTTTYRINTEDQH